MYLANSTIRSQRIFLVMRCIVSLTIAITFPSCQPREENTHRPVFSDTLAIITERDLIPEGTAYDPTTNRVFVSSMYKRKIVAIEPGGRYFDFIESGKDDLWSPLGMEVDSSSRKLWVVSTKGKPIPTYPVISDDRWSSKLYCYDLTSGKLNKAYSVNPKVTGEYGFNDLTVSGTGDVYITESLTSRLFVLEYGSDYIEEFLKPDGYTFLNGITLSPDNHYAFVSSSEGIIRIDLNSKDLTELKYSFTISPSPIDGLAFYENSLISHQSDQLTRFYLNSSLDSIVSHEIIDNKNLDSSTTGELGEDGWYFYIGNSQIQSGVDYANKRIKPMDSLENVVIKRKKLNPE